MLSNPFTKFVPGAGYEIEFKVLIIDGGVEIVFYCGVKEMLEDGIVFEP